MKLLLKQETAYLLRGGNLAGTPMLCSLDEMIKALADSIMRTPGLPCTVVETLGAGSMRWRMLPKKQVRELARAAHYERNLIPLEDYLQIDFFFK